VCVCARVCVCVCVCVWVWVWVWVWVCGKVGKDGRGRRESHLLSVWPFVKLNIWQSQATLELKDECVLSTEHYRYHPRKQNTSLIGVVLNWNDFKHISFGNAFFK